MDTPYRIDCEAGVDDQEFSSDEDYDDAGEGEHHFKE